MTKEFRRRVYLCARSYAEFFFMAADLEATPAAHRLAAKVHEAPESDTIFNDLAMRLDPGDNLDAQVAVGTDQELFQAVVSVWEQVAAEFNPGVDTTA